MGRDFFGLTRLGPSSPSAQYQQTYRETPCFLSILLTATLLRAALDAGWGEGGLEPESSHGLFPLSGTDWARLAPRLGASCTGILRGYKLPFIPFVVHLSRAMGAIVEAPTRHSPHELWRVSFGDRRYIPKFSRVADFRPAPCHLRALASTISGWAITATLRRNARVVSVRDACITLAGMMLADPRYYGLAYALDNVTSASIRTAAFRAPEPNKGIHITFGGTQQGIPPKRTRKLPTERTAKDETERARYPRHNGRRTNKFLRRYLRGV